MSHGTCRCGPLRRGPCRCGTHRRGPYRRGTHRRGPSWNSSSWTLPVWNSSAWTLPVWTLPVWNSSVWTLPASWALKEFGGYVVLCLCIVWSLISKAVRVQKLQKKIDELEELEEGLKAHTTVLEEENEDLRTKLEKSSDAFSGAQTMIRTLVEVQETREATLRMMLIESEGNERLVIRHVLNTLHPNSVEYMAAVKIQSLTRILGRWRQSLLRDLKNFVSEYGGKLDVVGWRVSRRRRTTERRIDTYYISASGREFKSRMDVVRKMGLA